MPSRRGSRASKASLRHSGTSRNASYAAPESVTEDVDEENDVANGTCI